MASASEKENFDLSGPLHLTTVDWKNAHHRRSIAASLVQGVKVLERDRQQNRQGPQALAPRWWEFFHFLLLRQLVDDADQSIFGAIYEFKPPASDLNNSTNGSPRYVIAFRGTIIRLDSLDSLLRDIRLNLHIFRNRLHQTSRFEITMQAVRSIVAAAGGGGGGDLNNIWLAGHSMGSALAMLAGKNMAKTHIFLEALLFNPPFISAPIERIKDKRLKHGIRITSSLIKAGLAIAMKGQPQRNRSEDQFAALSAWVPYLFVNPDDHICSEYIGYFKHRKKMEEIGAGGIERLATQNSTVGLFLSAMGKESEPPLHLIPSANLTVNLTALPDFKRAHGIHQWWRPDLQLKSNLYEYKLSQKLSLKPRWRVLECRAELLL